MNAKAKPVDPANRYTIQATLLGHGFSAPRVSEKGLVCHIQQEFVLRGKETKWIGLGVKLSALVRLRGEPFAAVTPGLIVQPDVLLPGEDLVCAVSNATEFVQVVPRGMGLVIAEPWDWPWFHARDIDLRVVTQ